MEKSPQNKKQVTFNDQKLHFTETTQNEEFKKDVCIPYFKDIYKDLSSRSDDKQKGINKISLLEYAALPGMLGERFFSVMDLNNDNYIDYREFLTGLVRIYCSTFDQKTKLVFDIYDFDSDGKISKEDISTILSYMPITKNDPVQGEGRFTQEGGSASDFNERVETLQEMYQILDMCFGDKQTINFKEFQKINEEITSDMLLSVLNLFREKLPCSENFWRYKRNYELHMQAISKISTDQQQANQDNPNAQSIISQQIEPGLPIKKTLASPQMTKVRPLSPYLENSKKDMNMNNNPLLRYAANKKDPNQLNIDKTESPRLEYMDDDDGVTNQIPIAQFKSMHLSKKERFIDTTAKINDTQLSPTSVNGLRDFNFNNIDHPSILSAVTGKQTYIQTSYCICGLPCPPDSDICERCQGKNSIHIEGEILKKQKKGGILKKYWFVLLGKELYCKFPRYLQLVIAYKHKGDTKHKDMQNLVGVHIKNEMEEILDQKTILYPFMLIFPNKRRIYYLQTKTEKEQWMDAIKKAIGYANLYDYYDVQESLGQGKYGVVKKGIHKKTQKEVAIKIVKKKELSIKDQELLKREIEVLKICQHPNIIKLDDVFENQDYIFIVMELLNGGDFFTFLEKRKFRISEENSRRISHQLATSLYYLHSFGIAHRDLKPENILMVNENEDSDIKLVDFGLSKTFGPGESCKEPFGTLCYVAPEILLQRSYDKAIDLWSLGVIIHLMLSGTLPFDSDDDREIARKTIYEEVTLSHPIWQTISDDAKDLVLKLLTKNKKQRITLGQVLDHPWIAKPNKKITELRKKSQDFGDKILQFVAYTNTDANKVDQHSPRMEVE